MRSVRAPTLSVLAAHALAWAAAIGLAFAPVYSNGDTILDSGREQGALGGAIVVLLFPVLLTVPAVAAVLFVRKWRWRQTVLWGSAVVLLAVCILTGFTIGMFFAPAALTIFLAAVLDLDKRQPAS